MSRGRVLLLEDDLALRGVLQEALASEQFEVITCESFETLRAAAAAAEGDVAVADFWGMAHRSLDDLARQQLQELNQLVPVMLVTGRSWAAATTAEALGVRAMIRKPFDLDELIDTLTQIL
jgi:two-component system, NtrC family, nitrogen regulation response regulator GlnG